MRKIIIVLILISFLPILFIGCNKEIVSEKNNLEHEQIGSNAIVVDSTLGFIVKIHDNTLCFDSANDVITALNVLHKMPANERRKWEASVGFTSAQTLLENIKSKIEVMSDENEFEELILDNKELILEASNNSYGIKSRIYGYYPYITGKNGFFVSESIWCKVFDGNLYSTNDFDRDGYMRMCMLSENKDLSGSNIQTVIVDFNWEDDILKSYHLDQTVEPTFIRIYQYNYTAHNPTKRSIFEMELINNYTTRTLSHATEYTQYYMNVYYNGTCCDPSGYVIYYAGKEYHFFRDSFGEWRINLPYATYLDDYPFSNPNWDDEYFGQDLELINKWYTYHGSVVLDCNYQAQKKIFSNWVNWGETVVWFYNVTADIELGKNVVHWSGVKNLDAGPMEDNYSNQDETGKAHKEETVYSMPLSFYQNDPPAKFKGCVSGTLGTRFCPETYNFSFTF